LNNYLQTVASQYANSPTILALIESFNAAVDPSPDIDNFLTHIWQVETAQGFGLDIWGRIVGVSRIIPSGVGGWVLDTALPVFGFKGMTDGADPFNQAPFMASGSLSNPATTLTDVQFRELILLKALANISRADSPAINTLLLNWMSDRGRAYVSDLGNMEIRYMFEFALEPFEIYIITRSGIFLKPAGVGGWMVNTPLPVFGFSGMADGAAPFGQAPFMGAENPYSVA
jgi:hypothetical protein